MPEPVAPSQLAEPNPEAAAHDRFITQALANLEATSRTRQGISDTTSSADKPRLEIEGEALADQATANFVRALEKAWQDRQRRFATAEELKAWIDQLAATVSDGLLKPNQALYRTWSTKFEHQTNPADLDREMRTFTEELLAQLDAAETDAIATAAWVEHTLDTQIHPFADGCGRTCKLVSAWVLLRAGQSLPKFDTRDRYLPLAIEGGPAFEAYYRERIAAQTN